MDPLELTTAVTALANAIACKLNTEQINQLAVILTQLGDTLTTIAARRLFCEGKSV